ncbi:armadillo repeat-containing protein 8-like isoform X5 [Argiope bruennichi]|uniref:armadillo repeat-containing protein 8-like isoform X5 n=1 Tax=Argiope bruennichi TaxID=94029 RepID=UPI0024945876|nr:armadillo repeat-containing protein 8-like isoform X5 [Argiope bruennichi]
MVNVDPYMDVENSQQEYIDRLYCPEPHTCLDAVRHLKNSVIGSNKQKGIVIQMGVLPRLFQFMMDKSSSPELMIEAAVTLGSLALGTDKHVEALLGAGLINVVLRGLASPHAKLMEACLRCLRTVLSRKDAPIEVLYDDPTLIPHLIRLAQNNSSSVQECVMTMLYSGCQTSEHQEILCENGALELLTPLLYCNIYRVQIPSLRCLAQMCYQNEKVSDLAVSANYLGKTIPDILVSLMSRDRNPEMQLIAAKCMTFMFRSGALSSEDSRIVYKALPTLVRMCQKDISPADRVEAAETLAYLAEVDTELQRIASISDHLIPTLAELLKYRATNENGEDISYGEMSKRDTILRVVEEVKIAQEMKQAAFKAFSSLAANDEDIRRKIIDTDALMESIVGSFTDPNLKVRLSAVRCLHSLSRSVQQLRTTFQDHAVWRPLMKLIQNANDEVLTVASSTLCNLLLEFSPSKEHIDHIMGLHGKQVMQSIVLILEGDHCIEVKEQALCILANIADGDFAKNFIMSNEDVLKKLTIYMLHSNVKLQIAATFCISNLLWKEEDGSMERQLKLKELGVQQILQQLLNTTDTTLFDRVKTALHQFPSAPGT